MENMKATIKGVEYEFEESTLATPKSVYGYDAPVIWIAGNAFVGKEIKKEKDIPKPDFEIIECWNADGFHAYTDRCKNHCIIKSVKRISDGEVFTVNQEIEYVETNRNI